jgi:hypothetical protein
MSAAYLHFYLLIEHWDVNTGVFPFVPPFKNELFIGLKQLVRRCFPLFRGNKGGFFGAGDGIKGALPRRLRNTLFGAGILFKRRMLNVKLEHRFFRAAILETAVRNYRVIRIERPRSGETFRAVCSL